MFEQQLTDQLIKSLVINKPTEETKTYQLCFIGERPYNTLKVHENFSGEGKYPFKFDSLYRNFNPQMQPFFKMFYYRYEATQKPPFFKNNPQLKSNPNILQFNSSYESGNLDCAIAVTDYEYDLFLRVDSNTKGHTLWYNFKVCNGRKGQTYTFNICNLYKRKTLYLRVSAS